ncbi:centromere/microtubule-binding protein cbf5 [Ascosphaera pollenicola]|nr:centromere/microtubule-binding protein cbf5 [Ascosphaera pollenicola]
MKQMRIQSFELKMIKANERRAYYENLDKIEQDREAAHNSALDEVVAKQTTIRKNAEEFLDKHLQKQEARRRQKEQEEKERQEKIAKRKAVKERKARAQQEAEERLRQEEVKKQKEQEAEAERERKAADEKKKKEDAAREQKEKEAQEKADQEAKQQKALPTTSVAAGRRTQDEIQNHESYLFLHQKLKNFRNWFEQEIKANPDLKKQVGEYRRTIKKCVGQLTEDKKANKTPLKEVIVILKKSLSFTEPSVDIREVFVNLTPEVVTAQNTQVSAAFVYLVNMLSKFVIQQLIVESGVTPKTGERMGVFVASVVSTPDLCFHGTSMIDIFLAKYHLVCPALFGFYGRESTEEGKDAIGWWREDRSNKGPFVPAQIHEERMIGLASGFAALSLRNFAKAKRPNPLPNRYFWQAVAYIVEVPPEEVQDTHLYILDSLLQYSAARVVQFWGDFGLALLRYATIDFVESVPRECGAKRKAQLLRVNWASENGIFIA